MKVAELFAELGIELDEASMKKAEAWLNKLGKKADKFGEMNKKIGKSIGTIATGVLGVAAAAGAALGIAVNDAMDFNKAITQLKISSAGAMGSADQMTAAFLRLSRATAISKEELVAGAQAYVAATGDGKGAIKATETFARVSRAASTPMGDVAKAGAAIQEQFALTSDQLEHAFDILIAGGKVGKIELTDMASLTSELAASYKMFGDSKGLNGLNTFGALFQVVAKDAGNAEGARTNLLNLFNAIGRAEFKLQKAFGKKASIRQGGKAGKGERKDILSILQMLKQMQALDPEKFAKAFGTDMQAGIALSALTLNDRLQVLEQIKQTTTEAGVVAKDLAEVDMSPSGQAERAWNDLKITIAEAFTPDRLAAFAKILATTVDLASNLAGWIEYLMGEGETRRDMGNAALDKLLIGNGTIQKPQRTMAEVERIASGKGSMREDNQARDDLERGGADLDDYDERGMGWQDAVLQGIKRRKAYEKRVRMQDEARRKRAGEMSAIDAMVAPPTVSAPGAAAGGTQISVQQTINATGMDPAKTVQLAKDAAAAEVQNTLREAAAGSAGG